MRFLNCALLVWLSLAVLPVRAGILIPGAGTPAKVHVKAETTYSYPVYSVTVEDRKGTVGQHITVYRLGPGGPGQGIWFTVPGRGGDYFGGLAADALLVISQTGPDATLKIYDLTKRRKVFEAGFQEGTARVVDRHFLEVEKLQKHDIDKLPKAEAQAHPEFKQWLAEGGSLGRFVKVRIDLTNFREKVVGQPVLHEMQ